MEDQFGVQRSLGRIEGGIDRLQSELTLLRGDHAGLRSEFNKLEAGRLTRLESAFASQEVIMKSKAKNTAVIYSAISAIIVSLVTITINHFLHL